MAHTNSTPYYNLPIFIGTDHPTWLGDFNEGMQNIDTAMQDIKLTSDSAENKANSANNGVRNNTNSINELQNQVDVLKEAVSNYENILVFKVFKGTRVANNTSRGSLTFISNNNRTMMIMQLDVTVPASTPNPITYNYTFSQGHAGIWFDLATIEDNFLKLSQVSLPTSGKAMSLGILTSFQMGTETSNPTPKNIYEIRAWFDGQTTHIGVIYTGGNLVNINSSQIVWRTPIFLSGSIISD